MYLKLQMYLQTYFTLRLQYHKLYEMQRNTKYRCFPLNMYHTKMSFEQKRLKSK